MKTRGILAAVLSALALAALGYAAALAHGETEVVGGYSITVGFLNEPAYEGVMNAISVLVTKPADDHADADGHDHSTTDAAHTHEETRESEIPISLSMSAEVNDSGGVSVGVTADNWRWAPNSVDMPHEPGAGHAHIYVDGVKIGRVYGPQYDLVGLEPGERAIRVTLNSNDHMALAINGEQLAVATTVTIPGAAMTSMAMDRGVEGLERTLKLDVTHVASETSRTFELAPLENDPGHYVANLIPTSQGQYRVRVYGDIEGEAVDISFDSYAGGGVFDDVQSASELQFPIAVASARETESAARGAQASAAAAQEAASDANDAASGASTIGFAGLAVGILGAAMGGAGLAVALASRRRGG